MKTPADRLRRRLAPAIALTALFAYVGCGKSAPPQARPPEVQVVEVDQKDVPIYSEWVGTLEGLVNAQIRPQVTGYLLRRTYQEGSFVKKGQLLFEIDPRTFQAALDQAKAQLANAEQQVALAEANQVKAQLDVDRYVPLAKEQAVTQQALDNAVQSNLAAQAQVRAAKAQIDAAKAQVETAQLNLGFTKIISLIDGIAGIAQAQIGDLVGPTTLLTTVSTLDPIKVYFPVSEQGYLNYVKENPDVAKGPLRKRAALELILAGLPSSLLERRPDIQAAEQILIAANVPTLVSPRRPIFPTLRLPGSSVIRARRCRIYSRVQGGYGPLCLS